MSNFTQKKRKNKIGIPEAARNQNGQVEGAEDQEAAVRSQALSSADTHREAAIPGLCCGGPMTMPARVGLVGGRTAYLDPSRAPFFQAYQACSSVHHFSISFLIEL